MRISFLPQLRYDALVLEKTSGNRLRINGELFNFNPLSDGDTIPTGEIPCEWIFGPVERIDGEVRLTLFAPCSAEAVRAGVFQVTVTVSEDGPIAVPFAEPKESDDVVA